MVLANRTKLANSRSLVRVFGGLNETYACSEAEYSAGVNFSARDFPALSTRKPRRKLRTLTGLNGMYHLNGLLTVCGKDLIYTPDEAGAAAVTLENVPRRGRSFWQREVFLEDELLPSRFRRANLSLGGRSFFRREVFSGWR